MSDWREVLAGLAAGATTLGQSMERRAEAKSAEERALARLIAQNNMRDEDWSAPFPAVVNGIPGMFQTTKSGKTRRVTLPGERPSVPDQGMPQSAPPAPQFPEFESGMDRPGAVARALQDLTGAPSAPPQGVPPKPPVRPPSVVSRPDATAAPLAPFVRPTGSTRIDPNSLEGLKADSTRYANRALFQPTTVMDTTSSTGRRVVSKADAVGKEAPLPAMAGGFGAGGIMGAGRTLGALEGMQVANTNMKKFESQVAAGKINLNGLDVFQNRLAQSFDEHGLVNKAAFSAAVDNVARTNPQMAIYLRDAGQWALEESLLNSRPSDFRTRMDEFVSTLTNAATTPEMASELVNRLWASRDARLRGYSQATPAIQSRLKSVAGPKTAAPAASPTLDKRTPAQKLWDEAVAKYGEERVVKEYGARP